jgi:cobaltochelatase CobN
VLIEPACGHTIDSNSAYQNSAPAPPHSWLAAHAWLADDFRADAVIHLGKQPDDTPGPSAACILDHLTAPPVRAGVCGMIAELEQLIGGRR